MEKRPRSSAKIVTQAQMRRAVAALEKDGIPFFGFHLRADGSVDVLVVNPAPPHEVSVKQTLTPGKAAIERWKKERGS